MPPGDSERGPRGGGWRRRFRSWRRWTGALLALAAALHLTAWFVTNRHVFLDTVTFHDDVRAHLFPFHRYGPGAPLRDDPGALDNLAYSTPLIRAAYAALVPGLGLFCAAKVVQALAFAIFAWAVVHLARSKRGGFAAGMMFLFLLTQAPWFAERSLSGLQRGFGCPTVALWGAGAITGCLGVRCAAAILAAGTYPTSMALILGAEGVLLAFRAIAALVALMRRGELAGRWAACLAARRKDWIAYACTALLCVGITGLFQRTQGSRGHPPLLAEVAGDPSYQRGIGRTPALPLRDARSQLMKSARAFFRSKSPGIFPALGQAVQKDLDRVSTIAFFLILVLACTRLSPVPWGAASLFVSSAVCFQIAAAVAFRLHHPSRFMDYGMPMAMALGLTVAAGRFGPRIRPIALRATLRNLAVLAAAGIMAFLVGPATTPLLNRPDESPEERKVIEFIRSLPPDSRLSGHPRDMSPVPFLTARAIVCSYETDVPWLLEPWRRSQRATWDTFQALYSTNRADVLTYCRQYGVTHLVIRADRVGPDFAKNATYFEPIGSRIEQLVSGRSPGQFALNGDMGGAVVFRNDRFRIVDVARLRAAWP